MGKSSRWFVSRLLVSAICLALAIVLFLIGNGYLNQNLLGIMAVFYWTLGVVFLFFAIIVWFYRRPSGSSTFTHERRGSPKTEHELNRDSEIQRQRELDVVRIDSHMVDRKW
ncbi:MAG TPA: hypothetical protein VMW85_01785 [Methanomassiliicoccales archaeon]|nr:hypothetical protein [Methanomassiliicoccales archaeon]